MQQLNGWQRIWLVLTCLALMLGLLRSGLLAMDYGRVLGDPLDKKENGILDRVWYERGLKADWDSGRCSAYIYEPYVFKQVSGLPDPLPDPYNAQTANCFYLNNARGVQTIMSHDVYPFTEATYLAITVGKERWTVWWRSVWHSSLWIIAGSGILYLIGLTVAWIRRGFSAAHK